MDELALFLDDFSRDVSIHFPSRRKCAKWMGYHQIQAGFGVWAVFKKNHVALSQFYRWKENPLDHRDMTGEMAHHIATLIKRWQPTLSNDWVITVPPQGASIYKSVGGIYPAGSLAREVSILLGLDFVTTLRRTDIKRRHSPQAALDQSPFQVTVSPPSVTLIVDDMISSGTTMRLALQAFRAVNVPAFGFVYIGHSHARRKFSNVT